MAERPSFGKRLAIGAALGAALGGTLYWAFERPMDVQAAEEVSAQDAAPVDDVLTGFDPAVLYWAPQIRIWSAEYGVQPQDVATLMQIESCGNPDAVSASGARGLFQVMPIHLVGSETSEDLLDPEFNAEKGLTYFAGLVAAANSDFQEAYADYNGGPNTPHENRSEETQRYMDWMKMRNPRKREAVLQAWYNAGGASLCGDAQEVLGLRLP